MMNMNMNRVGQCVMGMLERTGLMVTGGMSDIYDFNMLSDGMTVSEIEEISP
jgi:hypothetical protein